MSTDAEITVPPTPSPDDVALAEKLKEEANTCFKSRPYLLLSNRLSIQLVSNQFSEYRQEARLSRDRVEVKFFQSALT